MYLCAFGLFLKILQSIEQFSNVFQNFWMLWYANLLRHFKIIKTKRSKVMCQISGLLNKDVWLTMLGLRRQKRFVENFRAPALWQPNNLMKVFIWEQGVRSLRWPRIFAKRNHCYICFKYMYARKLSKVADPSNRTPFELKLLQNTSPTISDSCKNLFLVWTLSCCWNLPLVCLTFERS